MGKGAFLEDVCAFMGWDIVTKLVIIERPGRWIVQAEGHSEEMVKGEARQNALFGLCKKHNIDINTL